MNINNFELAILKQIEDLNNAMMEEVKYVSETMEVKKIMINSYAFVAEKYSCFADNDDVNQMKSLQQDYVVKKIRKEDEIRRKIYSDIDELSELLIEERERNRRVR